MKKTENPRLLCGSLKNLVRGKAGHYSDAATTVKNKWLGARGKEVRMRGIG
jgi:hypothetical protein